VSRVRENRTHGSTGGDWKRNATASPRQPPTQPRSLQSRIKRAFKRAGPEAQPVPGALVYGLRHTYATELASSEVSVYTLVKLLGHESMTSSQRYVAAAGSETRSAAARRPHFGIAINYSR
jgi:integrase/recombinase XerC